MRIRREEFMWKLICFVPLLALTIYIIIKSLNDPEEDEELKQYYTDLAIKLLKQGKDYQNAEDITSSFNEFDLSDPDDPHVSFVLECEDISIPFEIKNGNIIRYRSIPND